MKKNGDMISIIVPVYNVERYLEKCLKSIINQTYSNLEIILINDGSTDKSGEICDEFAKRDKRIRVIHKKNEGQSIARNNGLKIAKGALIGFVDSDDFVHFEMYEKLYNCMMENNADIVECAVEKIYNDKIIREESSRVFCATGKEALHNHLSMTKTAFKPRAAVWSRLYKKNVIKAIKFPEGKIHEDYYYTYRALLNCEKYCWLDECLYSHIYTNTASTTQQPFNKKDLAKIEIYKERMDYLYQINHRDLAILAGIRYYLLLLQYYYKASFSKMDEDAGMIKKELISNKDRIYSLGITGRKKLEFMIMLNFPNLYLLIRKAAMMLREY